MDKQICVQFLPSEGEKFVLQSGTRFPADDKSKKFLGLECPFGTARGTMPERRWKRLSCNWTRARIRVVERVDEERQALDLLKMAQR